MDVKTYRAGTMQEALDLVRHELGPEAAVLRTRDRRSGGLLGLLPGRRQVEITAGCAVTVPGRAPARHANDDAGLDLSGDLGGLSLATAIDDFGDGSKKGDASHFQTLAGPQSEKRSLFENDSRPLFSEPLQTLLAELIEADVSKELAFEIVERIATESPGDVEDSTLLRLRAQRMIESEIAVHGPLTVEPGRRRLVALVGPTGVGKTTTIAKLAAHFRLKEGRSVGLITVDTYRIAAVEQLRTYADIIDLPMSVVATPREMRQAVAKMNHLDLVLMDTAGRSPRDDEKLDQLREVLAEAAPDETHLVLSATAGAASLAQAAEQFSAVGCSALVLTKLDEVTGLGPLLPLLRSCRLPVSYVTDGQDVPHDIEPADSRRLARMVLGRGAQA